MIEPTKNQRGGNRAGAGRKPLPLNKKRQRVVVYVDPAVDEWIKNMGGNKFAAHILFVAYSQSLVQ